MLKSILFIIDELNYNGGANIATFNQIDYLTGLSKYRISVYSQFAPSEALKERFPNVTFIVDKHKDKQKSEKFLKAKIMEHDVVCVPFENSVYRSIVAESECKRKIQWIHIDYAYWRALHEAIRDLTIDDSNIYAKFDQIVFETDQARLGFVELYPELAFKCAVCKNLIDTERVLKLSEEPIGVGEAFFFRKSDALHIVTVARLDDIQKAIKRSLDVAKKLKDDGYNFEWLFIGDGIDRDKIYKYAKTLDLSDCVYWSGHQDNTYKYVKNADLFALFSYYEGIPYTVYESLIVGTPVIATKTSGVKEQVVPGTGWLVDNDKQSIYQGLKYILDNKELIEQTKEKLKTYTYDNEEIHEHMAMIFDNNEPYSNGVIEQRLFVSIIVPVYNTEKYLSKCLDSLVSQTLESIEIIIVNDGSTDSSQEIIDRYREKYPSKIISLVKENGGLGDARNYGIKHASGKYVAFIDSDDWVTENMMERMYMAAIDNHAEIVLCDIYGVDDKTGYTVVEEAPYENNEGILEKTNLVRLSTLPVTVSACTKIYRREIFERFQFPLGWYEDMALIPTIYSYVNRVYYLSEPHYSYRWNRQGSIQSQKSSRKTLEILNSKQNILNTCNPGYIDDAAYAVYRHCARFIKEHPVYEKETLDFIDRNITYFENNVILNKWIDDYFFPKFFNRNKIPKTIHYCWFGNNEKSEIIVECINSWKEYLPDYEIIEWNETNCNIKENPYVEQAYECGKWAYVSDYFRFKALYEHGGIYLDTDVKLYRSFDKLLFHNAFFAFETYLYVHGGIMGAQKNQPVMLDIINSYEKEEGYDPDRIWTVCHRITETLLGYGLQQNSEFQVLQGDIAVYPPNILTVDFSDGECIAEHLYEASWTKGDNKRKTYRYEVLKHFFLYPVSEQHKAPTQPAPELTAYNIMDQAIDTCGLKITIRQLLKKSLKRMFPKLLR